MYCSPQSAAFLIFLYLSHTFQSMITMSHSLGYGCHVTFIYSFACILLLCAWSPGGEWPLSPLGNSLFLRPKLVPIHKWRVYFSWPSHRSIPLNFVSSYCLFLFIHDHACKCFTFKHLAHIISHSYLHACSSWTQHIYTYILMTTHTLCLTFKYYCMNNFHVQHMYI